MTREHRQWLQERKPEGSTAQIMLFSALAPELGLMDIPDHGVGRIPMASVWICLRLGAKRLPTVSLAEDLGRRRSRGLRCNERWASASYWFWHCRDPCCCACLSGMDAIFASLIKAEYPVFMLQGVRNWICVAMLGLWLLARDGKHFNPLRQGAPLMLARGALVYCTAMMFFIALKDLDLGTVTTLLFFYPVVATIIAAVFLREPIGLWRGLAVVLVCGCCRGGSARR